MGRPLRVAVLAVAAACAYAPASPARVDLVGNGRGDQVLLHQVLGKHDRQLYAGLRAGGGSFDPFVPISAPVDVAQRQLIVDDAGGAVIGWTTGTYERQPGALMVVTRAPGGSFGPPVQLASDATLLWLYGNGRGDTMAVWYTQGSRAMYSFRPAGGSFGPPQALDRLPLGVAIDEDGSATAVFPDPTGSEQLAVAKRPPEGGFGPAKPIPGTEGALGGLLGAAPNGRALLAWPTRNSVFAMDRQPGGDFGSRQHVRPRYSPRITGVLVQPSGAAAIRFGNEGTDIAVRAPGGKFSAAARVAGPPPGEPADLDINDRGDAATSWQGTNGEVMAAYHRAGAPTWNKAVEVAAGPLVSPVLETHPSVAVPASGSATVAWEQSDGERVRTYTRTLRVSILGHRRLVDSIASYLVEGPPSACRPTGVRRLLSGPAATVFREGAQIFGCFLRRGAPVPLFSRAMGFAAHTMSLEGPLVAYGHDDDSDARSGTESVIRVLDLRDPEFGLNRGAVMERDAETAILLATRLRRNGAIAWLSCPDGSGTHALAKSCRRLGGETKHLFVWGSRVEEPRLVATSRWIDRRTLNLRGSLLTWRDGRKLHRARLR